MHLQFLPQLPEHVVLFTVSWISIRNPLYIVSSAESERYLYLDASLNSGIQPEDITELEAINSFNERVNAAVKLFMPA